MRQQMSERELLLKRLQICDFVLVETHLFLDTHPHDREALAYWQKYKVLRDAAYKEFTEKFGPVNLSGAGANGTTWDWIDDPWPWEGVED